ncbi:MAG TPA: hypothetical protein VEH47_07975 [Candidatus Acidoferrales bacterium]|nr:hypothetical protein [Candidatus Acidoferrales bacterium]
MVPVKELFELPLHTPDFWWIFLVALLVMLVKAIFKCITKLPIFIKEPPDASAIKAAKFDCMRMGLDMAFIGLVTVFAVFRLAFKSAQQARSVELDTLQGIFVLIQIGLVGLATFVTTIYHSPEKSFVKGIAAPFMVGWLSIYTSALVFRWLLAGVG